MGKDRERQRCETTPWVLGKFHALALRTSPRDGAMRGDEPLATKYRVRVRTHVRGDSLLPRRVVCATRDCIMLIASSRGERYDDSITYRCEIQRIVYVRRSPVRARSLMERSSHEDDD